MGNSSRFRILPFDLRAAVEVADMTATAISSGDKKAGNPEPWQKVKIDRQIAAIGNVEQVTIVYTDDRGVIQLAKAAGVQTVRCAELPLPPEDSQISLDI